MEPKGVLGVALELRKEEGKQQRKRQRPVEEQSQGEEVAEGPDVPQSQSHRR
jgi:hypothetical protein